VKAAAASRAQGNGTRFTSPFSDFRKGVRAVTEWTARAPGLGNTSRPTQERYESFSTEDLALFPSAGSRGRYVRLHESQETTLQREPGFLVGCAVSEWAREPAIMLVFHPGT